MTDYYKIRDRVPRAEIDALTSEALREYVKRNGWDLADQWQHPTGVMMADYAKKDQAGYWLHVLVSGNDEFRDRSRRMREAVESIVAVDEKRAHVVIDEIRAIAEWQARCAAWVAPEGNCGNCWTCERELADPWEAPRPATFGPLCPTCGNKRCPRATDHRNACSGPNEPGQKGSRYA